MATAAFRGLSTALMVMAIFVFVISLRVAPYPSFFLAKSADWQLGAAMLLAATSIFIWNISDEKGGKHGS